MENKNNSLKIALTYIAIFFLVILIAVPPVLRVILKDDNKSDDSFSNDQSTVVLHCTRKEVVGAANYNIQVFNTYTDNILEKVIIRYNRTGSLDESNQNNSFEQEIAKLRANTNILESVSNNNYKFEINKEKIRAYSWNYNRLSIESGQQFRRQILDEMKAFKANKTFYHWLDSYNQRLLDVLISGIRNTIEIDKEKEDMAHLLIDTLKEGRRYSIVSAGTYANRIILLMQYMNIEAATVYDNSDDKVGKIFNGYTIEPIDNICNNDRNDIYIIANKNNSDELKKQLEILGIKKDNIKIFDNLYDWTRLIDIYNHIEST